MTYPTPGSLGAELFEMDEQDFVERFGEPLDRPQNLTMPLDRSLRDLVALMLSKIPSERGSSMDSANPQPRDDDVRR